MEQEAVARPAPPAPVAAVAAPAPLGYGAAMLPETTPVGAVLSLQKTAGNQAVCRAIANGQIMRDDKQVSVTGVGVSPNKFTVPLEAGTTVKATAQPANATGVTWKLEDGTVAVTGSTIDDKGTITVGSGQPGGKLKATATSDDGASAWSELRVIEKPASIDSTSGSATGTYAAAFKHTFKGAKSSSGLEDENINEKFDSLKATTPFGPFSLTANAAGSAGWNLDGAGTMKGPDNVSIDKGGIDANKFVQSASNPSPAAALPQGFAMTQKLHAKSFPSGKLDDSPFTTTDHVRQLAEDGGKLVVNLTTGKKTVSIDYAGPAVYRNAKASKTSVEASPPKPKTGAWKQNEVTVTVDAQPAGAKVKFSFNGPALGCTVDSSGTVKIGDQAGTIKVRAGDGGTHFDEIDITITARPAPAPARPTGAGEGEAGPAVASPAAEGEPAAPPATESGPPPIAPQPEPKSPEPPPIAPQPEPKSSES